MKIIDTAMVLAAGFGKRLKPITDNLPKPLVLYNGKPMIEYVLSKLENFGIKKIIINSHYLHEKMQDYFQNRKSLAKIILLYEKNILGTGGALKNALPYLIDTNTIILHNADVISDVNLTEFAKFHFSQKSDVSLCVQNRPSNRNLIVNSNSIIIGRVENSQNVIYSKYSKENQNFSYFAFCGIHLINTEILKYLPEENEFDIIPYYMNLIRNGFKLSAYDISSVSWKDLGTPLKLS
jgi:NDP-sugar pyrophosphorylase family protein